MNNVDVLVRYCEQHLIENPLFVSYIKSDPCFVFPLINKERLNPEQINLCNIVDFLIKKQTIKNAMFIKAIEILRGCPNVVGMKGIFMQILYYDDCHIRLFNDLDLLVSPKEACDWLSVFVDEGYTLKKGENVFDNNTLLIKFLGRTYFKESCHVELIKEFDNRNILLLELHANLNKCNSGRLSFDVDSMIASSIEKNIKGFQFKVFCPEDLIAYLMFHTIKHLSYISLSRNKHKTVNLQCLYDVAQVITYEDIDWELFLEKIKQYSIVPFVAIYLKIFTDVYADKIPCWIVKEVHSLIKMTHFKWEKVYSSVMSLSTETLILGDFSVLSEL